MRRTRFNLLSPTLFALMVLEILYLAGAVHFAGLFSTVGADFRAPYAAARIAREEGFPHIYDLERHMPIQRALCRVAGSEAQCVLIPMVFLPVFLLPIPPLTFLSPVPAFVLWSGLNLFGTLPVLHPWLRSLPPAKPETSPANGASLFSRFLQPPVGPEQPLADALREPLSAGMGPGTPVRAGLWAGGLLLKPQTMVLLAPALVLARQWGVLAGLGAGVAVLGIVSFLLDGPGMAAWARILMGFSPPVPGLAPEVVGAETMMNWRSIGLLLSVRLPSPLAWGIAGLGILLTVGAAIGVAWPADLRDAERREQFTWGILAATLAATWGTPTVILRWSCSPHSWRWKPVALSPGMLCPFGPCSRPGCLLLTSLWKPFGCFPLLLV